MNKPKNRGFDAPYADEEERRIMGAVARGEFKPRRGSRSAIKAEWKAAAINTLRRKPITIRVQERDIHRLKALALAKGMPYQTLVASIIHQYVSGALKEQG